MLQALYTSIAVYVQGMRNMFDLLSTEELTKQTLDVVFVVVEVVVVDLTMIHSNGIPINMHICIADSCQKWKTHAVGMICRLKAGLHRTK